MGGRCNGLLPSLLPFLIPCHLLPHDLCWLFSLNLVPFRICPDVDGHTLPPSPVKISGGNNRQYGLPHTMGHRIVWTNCPTDYTKYKILISLESQFV